MRSPHGTVYTGAETRGGLLGDGRGGNIHKGCSDAADTLGTFVCSTQRTRRKSQIVWHEKAINPAVQRTHKWTCTRACVHAHTGNVSLAACKYEIEINNHGDVIELCQQFHRYFISCIVIQGERLSAKDKRKT